MTVQALEWLKDFSAIRFGNPDTVIANPDKPIACAPRGSDIHADRALGRAVLDRVSDQILEYPAQLRGVAGNDGQLIGVHDGGGLTDGFRKVFECQGNAFAKTGRLQYRVFFVNPGVGQHIADQHPHALRAVHYDGEQMPLRFAETWGGELLQKLDIRADVTKRFLKVVTCHVSEVFEVIVRVPQGLVDQLEFVVLI